LNYFSWNESWVQKENSKYLIALIVISVVLYITSAVWIIFFFQWFTSGEECDLNKTFIALTIIFSVIHSAIAISNWCGMFYFRVWG